MSRLPSYEDVADCLDSRGWTAAMIPQKKPTRKGLVRYAAQSVLRNKEMQSLPYWQQLWLSAREAHVVMRWLGFRAPADAFEDWRLQVRLRLQDPEVRQSHPDGERAYKWASR